MCVYVYVCTYVCVCTYIYIYIYIYIYYKSVGCHLTTLWVCVEPNAI